MKRDKENKQDIKVKVDNDGVCLYELLFYSYINYFICTSCLFWRTTQMKVSENTSVAMPIKNMIGIIIGVAMGIFAYTELTSRIQSLETSRELFQADLLKKSEQKPTDQEQFMLLEHIAEQVENIQTEMETMRNNNVNITYAMKDIEKIKEQLEIIKDKVRANGSY